MRTRDLALAAALLTACGGAPASGPTSKPGAHAGHGRHHGPAADDAAHVSHQMPHRFDDPQRWAKRFEDPARDAWQKPDEVVNALVDRDDLLIVDIGAATGYFPVRFARAAPQGKVVGVDIEPSMVQYLTARAQEEGLANLSARLGQPDDPMLGDLNPDLVFLCNTYHHISDREAYFAAIRARMAPGGRLAIVDFRKDSERGPPAEHKIALEQTRAELEAAGWVHQTTHDFLPDQYIAVFTAPAGG